MSQPDPRDTEDDDPLEREAMDFLLAQREEAIAQGVDFIGAITGGNGIPRVISYVADPAHRNPDEDPPTGS